MTDHQRGAIFGLYMLGLLGFISPFVVQRQLVLYGLTFSSVAAHWLGAMQANPVIAAALIMLAGQWAITLAWSLGALIAAAFQLSKKGVEPQWKHGKSSPPLSSARPSAWPGSSGPVHRSRRSRP